jgi:2-dehydro-3-deoxyphosphooctonate aldolase (KDO 8-P synthase)
MHQVPVKDYFIGKGEPFTVICGPCVIENEEHCLESAKTLKTLFNKLGVRLIFKSSYDKANRSSGRSFRGPGLKKGLQILQRVQKELDLPVTTDVHSPEEATEAGRVCDIIQIPAFLSRQTDLILAAGHSGTVVSVKKGQFMAPWDMKNVVDKLLETGNKKIILIDRGTTFGYNNLVSDMRAIPLMQQLGYPVCYDATHSVQLPGGNGETSGGQREFIPVLAKAAIAAGANCLFLEAHPDPKNAKSDSASVISFEDLPALLIKLKQLYEIVN